MKKTLLFAAAAFAAISANAETFTYDFNTNPPFCASEDIQALISAKTNYDFIDKYGTDVNTNGEHFIADPVEGETKGVLNTNRVISLLDGQTYCLTPDAEFTENYGTGVIPEENLKHPFIGWGEKGLTRTLLMAGWGSLDAWVDDNYNGATEADWVSTKNGIAFNRLGTLGIVSRQDTYIQFPELTGNVTVSIWAGTASDKNSSNQNLNVLVTPVIDGVADAEKAVNVVKESGSFPEKRMIKLDPIQFDATGKKLAVRVGCNGNQLHIYHVVLEGEPVSSSGIENVAVDNVDNANAPVYNLMGIQVDDSYKGIVIKNGKKYVQK